MGRVNVEWICKPLTDQLKKKYFCSVSSDAVYLYKRGWICDCGRWTTGDDDFHFPISVACRIIYPDDYE